MTLSPALCAILLKPHDQEKDAHNNSFVSRFHSNFNRAFDKTTNKYKNIVTKIIGKKWLVAAAVAIGFVALGITMATTKTGLVPDEDTGTLFVMISANPGTSQERTREIVKEVDKMLATNPAIQRREGIVGYNFIAGQGSDQATFIIKLKPFEERSGGFFARIKHAITQGDPMALIVNPLEANSVLGMIYKQTATIKDAQILAFGPPMVPGFSMQNGITMTMEDKTGGDLNKFFKITQDFIQELSKRPEIQTAMTTYNPNYPQYMVDVDVAKTKQAGISPTVVLSTLQGYLGGMYASNFNAYGKLFRVMIQAAPNDRLRPEQLSNIYVRTANGQMSPVSEFCTLKRVYGPSNIARFNLFTAINVSVTPNTKYSSGQAMQAIAEVAKNNLPAGYG